MQANPVIMKELRGRMRGWRAAVVLTFYLVVLSVITLLFYLLLRPSNFGGGTGSSQVGRLLFSSLVVFQTIMVSLLTPAFTSGAITSEREQKTYDLLMTTLLPARSVIFGKLGSALAYVVLLILALAPLESLAFMFGGVSPEEIILSQVVMLFAALLFASVGIFWSTVVRTSVGSNVLTYGTILFQLIGIPILYYAITAIIGAYSYNPNANTPTLTSQEWFWYMSGVILSSHPLIAMGLSEAFLSRGDSLFIYTSTQMLNGKTLLVVSPWLLFCIEAFIVSALFVLLSIRLVRPVRYKKATRSQTYAPNEPYLSQTGDPELAPGQDSLIEELPEPMPAQEQPKT